MDFLDDFEDGIDAETLGAEAKAAGILARRIGQIGDGLSLAEALSRVSEDLAAVQRVLGKAADDVARASEGAEAAVVDANDDWAADAYEASGAVATGAAAAIVSDARKEAVATMRAALKTSVVGLVGEDMTGFVPLREGYRAVLSGVAAKMKLGEATGEKAVAQAVRRLSAGGLRVVYDSGRSMELHSAVRMNVGDAFRKAMGDARLKMGEEFGADGVEVSAHGLCAPDHLPFQGRQYTVAQFERIQSRLDRPIGEGYNCRHSVSPVLLGVSKPAYSEAELDEVAELSEREVSFTVNGATRTMTRYEFSQFQRKMERDIRKARMGAYVAESAGTGAVEEKRRVRDMLRSYRTVSQQAGVETRLERTKLYIPR